MTALIYKAALPTYTSAEALAANADENLVLNQAGTAYELEPAQGGASVAPTDRLWIFTAGSVSMPNTNWVSLPMPEFDTPPGIVGTSMSMDGIGILIEEDGLYSFTTGVTFDAVAPGLVATTFLYVDLRTDPNQPEHSYAVAPATTGSESVQAHLLNVDLVAGQTVRVTASHFPGDALNVDYAYLYGRRLA